MVMPDEVQPVETALQTRLAELEQQVAADRNKIDNLETALVSARRIGAAVGIIMATYKRTEEQAFDVLRMMSQTQNRKLRDVADDVLLTGLADPPPAEQPGAAGRTPPAR